MSDVRLDKWLWAARLFKTRAQARAAVVGGKVDLNGHRAKPAKTLEPGDRLRVQRGQDVFVLTVREISDRRGPASQAQKLYEEDPASIAQREALAAERRARRVSDPTPERRPDKRQRRQIVRFRRGD